MKYGIVCVLVFFLSVCMAEAEQREVIPYGEAATINVCLWELDATDLEDGAECAAGDIIFEQPDGTQTAISCPTGFDAGTCYKVSLSASRTQVSQGKVLIIDQSNPKIWLDKTVGIYTCGSVNAYYESCGSDTPMFVTGN